jgi:hypothetical protein
MARRLGLAAPVIVPRYTVISLSNRRVLGLGEHEQQARTNDYLLFLIQHARCRALGTLIAIWRVTDAHPFDAPIALRCVKSSDALLAFTYFPPITCTIEMPGVDSAAARAAHQAILSVRNGQDPERISVRPAAPTDFQTVVAGFGPGPVNR